MLLKYLSAAKCYIQELWVKFMHWDFAILPV